MTPRAYQREMDDEFRFHLELEAMQRGAAAGPAPHATRQFGSATRYREETRRMTILGFFDVLRQDGRYGWRSLRRSPAFTVTAVLSLALGIGANTAIFGLVYSVLLEPLPVVHPERLVGVQRHETTGAQNPFPVGRFSLAELERLRATRTVRVTGFTRSSAEIEMNGQKLGTSYHLVDGAYFNTIGVRPLLGRFISPDDDRQAAPVVVISELDWEHAWNRDPRAIGATMKVQGMPFTVIGVIPRRYQGLTFPGDFIMAVPLSTAPMLGVDDINSAAGGLTIVGRLQDVSATAATTEIASVFAECCGNGGLGIPGKDGSPAAASRVSLVDISHGIVGPKFDLRGQYRDLLLILMAGVAVVLLIACANVANLLLARATARAREMAVRLSVGATRERLVRQLLTESLALALLGGLLGFALAWMGTGLLIRYLPGSLTDFTELVTFRPKPTLLGFTALVSFGCILVFGLLPAMRAAATDLVTPLKDGGEAVLSWRRHGGRGLMRRSVVIAQVSLALLLVTCAGLLGATLRNLRNVNGGFATERVLLATIDTRGTSYAHRGGIAPIHAELLERIRRLPGVSSAAMSSYAPVYGGRSRIDVVRVPGYAGNDDATTSFTLATPGFFAASGIGLRVGRDFTATDGASSPQVAIVSAEFVRRYFPGHDPIGAIIVVGSGSVQPLPATIVGVSGDALYEDLRGRPEPMVYFAFAQWSAWPFGIVTMRTAGDGASIGAAVQRTVAAFSPELFVYRPQAMEQALDEALSRERLAAGLATVFAAIALLLAAIGLYGVVNYGVSRRRTEIAVRMALGARASNVVWDVLRGSLIMVGIGVLIGVPLAYAGGGTVSAMLFGVSAHDATLFTVAALVLVAVAIVAAALPAARAARVSPLVALRAL
jgi:predicted permease